MASPNGSLLTPSSPVSPIDPLNSNRRASGVSNGTSRGSNSDQPSQHSSVRTFMSTTTQTTAISSLLASENSHGNQLEAEVFETPKEPLLVLFLRPRRQRVAHLPHLQYLSLMKVPCEYSPHGIRFPSSLHFLSIQSARNLLSYKPRTVAVTRQLKMSASIPLSQDLRRPLAETNH